MNEIHAYALKLLKGRDHSVSELREKLERKFGAAPEEIIEQLLKKRFLNDRRFAENYVARRREKGVAVLRQELEKRGIAAALIEEILSAGEWPSLRDALKAKMDGWNLRPPFQPRDAGRLFRALARLGYEEDAIREEVQHVSVSERRSRGLSHQQNEQ